MPRRRSRSRSKSRSRSRSSSKGRASPKNLTGYCMRCKSSVKIVNPKVGHYGQRDIKIACGKCAHCSTKVCRILPKH